MQPSLLFNSLLNNRILDWSRWKALANDKINFAKMMIIFDREIIVDKKTQENVDYQHFFLFHNVFEKLLPKGLLTVWIIW